MRTQLRAMAARLAEVEEAERHGLARELHDRVGQNLTALGINLSIVQSLIPLEIATRTDPLLADAQRLLSQTAERIRDVMAELRPPVLDDYGLFAALQWYGDQMARRAGLTVNVGGEEVVPRLSLNAETALFRIAQEALVNVVKHAQAHEVVLHLENTPLGARLTVADDGMGFAPAALSRLGERRGWGLLIMQERAEAVGGRLSVEAMPGQGTRIVVDVAR